MNNGIKKYLFLPKRILKAACAKGYFNYLSDRRYIKLVYWLRMNKTLHLDTPQTFNEKLQWLKLHDRKPESTNKRLNRKRIKPGITHICNNIQHVQTKYT
jgi:hypothetical protein